ncbi:hypothetical protein Ate01nite_47970 [Actinoplanes teichomyceticus]|nr:hypothetical protein Ate01nite_47970 [Actinoplanes teichomyceticus]
MSTHAADPPEATAGGTARVCPGMSGALVTAVGSDAPAVAAAAAPGPAPAAAVPIGDCAVPVPVSAVPVAD